MLKTSIRSGKAAVAAISVLLAACGGGGGGGAANGPAAGPAPNFGPAISAAAANAANDTATSTSASFAVLQSAGIPAVTINSPPVVNFTVFSDGKVVQGLTLADMRFALAKLVPG